MTDRKYSSVFQGDDAIGEVFFALESHPADSFKHEAADILMKYEIECAKMRCSADTEIFLRFHLDDISDNVAILRQTFGERNSFVSFIGQKPLNGGRVALEAWHMCDTGLRKSVFDNSHSHEVDIKLDNYDLLYHCRRRLKGENSGTQIVHEFYSLERALRRRNGDIAKNCLRTWIYCKDIDNNYSGLVEARRELFYKYGLNEDSNYISSTGIQGDCEDKRRLIGMDSYCVFGLEAGQVEYMRALDHLPPTSDYGVTFERGTRIIFGDRSHYYISGTASIDKYGEIMHVGDVAAQTERTVENIRALLANHDAELADLKIAVVYLRNPEDADCVKKRLELLLPESLPLLIVKAPVCRPGWLVEIDAVGINAHGQAPYKKLT